MRPRRATAWTVPGSSPLGSGLQRVPAQLLTVFGAGGAESEEKPDPDLRTPPLRLFRLLVLFCFHFSFANDGLYLALESWTQLGRGLQNTWLLKAPVIWASCDAPFALSIF